MRHLASFAALAALASVAGAQTISYTGGTYAQNFDGLNNTGSVVPTGRGPHALAPLFADATMNGWYAANPLGSSANTEIRAQNGSLSGSAGRGVVSFGADGSTERALGTLPTSNQISSFGALFVNDTGTTLTEIRISYIGEQWRRGDVPDPNALVFSYGFASSIEDATTLFPALDLLSINLQAAPTNVALDGNDPANQAIRNGLITNVNWAPGATLAIRWITTEQSGQDDGLSIDNFQLTAIPAPGTGALLALGLMGMARRRR